eukprot:SM000125S26089  [mRNA]  locus=s125:255885:257464:- [translate_table: standard]
MVLSVHGAFGSGWLDLLQQLARRAIDRRQGQQGELPGFNSAGSLAQSSPECGYLAFQTVLMVGRAKEGTEVGELPQAVGGREPKEGSLAEVAMPLVVQLAQGCAQEEEGAAGEAEDCSLTQAELLD